MGSAFFECLYYMAVVQTTASVFFLIVFSSVNSTTINRLLTVLHQPLAVFQALIHMVFLRCYFVRITIRKKERWFRLGAILSLVGRNNIVAKCEKRQDEAQIVFVQEP